MTSAGTSWPLWWKVFETCDTDERLIAVDRLLPDDGGRLDQLAEPIDVVAAAPASAADVDHRRLDRPAQVGRQLAAVDEDAGRQRRPDLGQVARDRRQRPLRLAHAVARAASAGVRACTGCFGLSKTVAASPSSTILPAYITPDPIAQRPDDPEVVGDEQDGGVGLGLERAHEVEHARLDGRVEPGRRLVEDEQLGVGGECDGDDDALLHPARQLVRVALGDPLGIGDLDPLAGP